MEEKAIEQKEIVRAEYGIPGNFTDVTFTVLQSCLCPDKTTILIPADDAARAALLGDPLYGVVKTICLHHTDGAISLCGPSQPIRTSVSPKHIFITATERLAKIHASVKLVHGSFQDEFPEQCLSAAFIRPDATVLELGSNVGRNTLVIASLLQRPENLITMECDPNSYAQLLQNQAANPDLCFVAENAALSNIPLIQQGWNTMPLPEDGKLPGPEFAHVNTISFSNLEKKYNRTFDTLVADCEGALFYILQQDAPNVLKNINLLILENDFTDIRHKQYVDATLKTFGFKRIYYQTGGWGVCQAFFYEVWAKH